METELQALAPLVYKYLIDASFAKTAKRLKAESKLVSPLVISLDFSHAWVLQKNIELDIKKEKTSLVTLCSSYLSKLKKRKRSESTADDDATVKNESKKKKKAKKSKNSNDDEAEANGKKSSMTKTKTKKKKKKVKSDEDAPVKNGSVKKEKQMKKKKLKKAKKKDDQRRTEKAEPEPESNGNVSKANNGAVDREEYPEVTQVQEKRPFSRVDEEKVCLYCIDGAGLYAYVLVLQELSEIKDERLKDNTYAGTFGDEGWGAKASRILVQVRGKDFRHEKTKKKRGGYRGGAIDFNAVRSVKFED